jgi:hypothetical protein
MNLCLFLKTERINGNGIFTCDTLNIFLEAPESLKFSCYFTDSVR